MIHVVAISEISRLLVASVAAQAGLSLTWSESPRTVFLVTRLNFLASTSLIVVMTNLVVVANLPQLIAIFCHMDSVLLLPHANAACLYLIIGKKLIEKSRECHNHKPQRTP